VTLEASGTAAAGIVEKQAGLLGGHWTRHRVNAECGD
jgi:hypothetical protein